MIEEVVLTQIKFKKEVASGGGVVNASVSNDQLQLLVVFRNEVQFYSLETSAQTKKLFYKKGDISHCIFGHDSSLGMALVAREMLVWNFKTNSILLRFTQEFQANLLIKNPINDIVCCSNEAQFTLFDIMSKVVIKSYEAGGRRVILREFMQNGIDIVVLQKSPSWNVVLGVYGVFEGSSSKPRIQCCFNDLNVLHLKIDQNEKIYMSDENKILIL